MSEHRDGATLSDDLLLRADVVVVGSGPAGATVAHGLRGRGARVVVVETGAWRAPSSFPPGAFASMARDYRAMGAQVTLGNAPMPVLQGVMVGGGSPINGAICWRMPHDVHAAWVRADPALADALPLDAIERATDLLEVLLDVRPTDPAVAGRKAELMALGADALGLEHRPIRRNVTGCEGLGRCIQGCPNGRKNSVDRVMLRPASASSAAIAPATAPATAAHEHGGGSIAVVSQTQVGRVLTVGSRAVGVEARAHAGGRVRVEADAVVLAASVVQTPALLLASGIGHGPVGRHFQCHPGVAVAGRFVEPVRMWQGATQGHEVIGLRHEGLKFETLGFGLAVLASRLRGVGSELADNVAAMAHWLDWGVAIKSDAEGRVRVVRGLPVVQYSPSAADVARMRRGARVLGDMLFAAGADSVDPGVAGFSRDLRSPRELAPLEHSGPRRAAAFHGAITHLFGTCRLGSDPGRSVVRPDFRHHAIDRLYVADASVFPTNLGVNPQLPIMALAWLAAGHIAAALQGGAAR